MALGPRLEFRQSQSLVMTPQLLQAIKLLQLSTVELSAYVETELERNPLLERVERDDEAPFEAPSEALTEAAGDNRQEGDWAGETMGDRSAIEADLGTSLENAFPDDAPQRIETQAQDQQTFQAFESGMRTGGSFDGGENSLEAFAAADMSLADHLEHQLGMAVDTPQEIIIGNALIAAIDSAGYLLESTADIAQRLGVREQRVLDLLTIIQGFEPTGVGARSLSECLALQLKENNRYDPAMRTLVENLDLLAKRDFASIRRHCQVDDEDIAEMVAEIRRLDPKPGLRFGGATAQAVIPDVIVRAAQDGGWHVELNQEALPKVLLNRAYFTRVSRDTKDKEGKGFIEEAWTTANWLVRSLEQRSRTILKVSSEIVRQQDGFFAYGVTHLRPLNLKAVAEAVELHESTVSRVTSNKFMATQRGIFEMKYFFTASIAGSAGSDAHSAEAVRHRIKQLIDQEGAEDVLSDDAIVERLKGANIEIARRTVAKYRESLRIPSSAIRRREKRSRAARVKT